MHTVTMTTLLVQFDKLILDLLQDKSEIQTFMSIIMIMYILDAETQYI